jgi:hypothetical protein
MFPFKTFFFWVFFGQEKNNQHHEMQIRFLDFICIFMLHLTLEASQHSLRRHRIKRVGCGSGSNNAMQKFPITISEMFHLREVIRVHYAHAVCRILQRVTRAKSM